MPTDLSCNPPDLLTSDLLNERLPPFLGRNFVSVGTVSTDQLPVGTSGAELFSVVVDVDGKPDSVSLVLKISRPGKLNEAQFYRDLASIVPVETPRIVASGIEDNRGWVLMEHISARSSETWVGTDYEYVVRDMARLHACHWGATDAVRREWLSEITPEAAAGLASQRLPMLDRVEESWLMNADIGILVGDVTGSIRLALENVCELAQPLWDAGLTLVHGDYWHYNVLLAEDGRRILVDWQCPMLWSGYWELAYFLNLLPALGDTRYRRLPMPEPMIVEWYRSELASNGVVFDNAQFERALRAARLLHPLMHWLPQLQGSASHPEYAQHPRYPQVRDFFSNTFRRWSIDFKAATSQLGWFSKPCTARRGDS